MPSYDDVLLVVKQGDAESVAVAAYFKSERHLPDRNVLTLALASSVPTLAARDAFIRGIKDYLALNQMEDQINYIVLSANFPRICKDTATSSYNAMFDGYLMWALSDTYPDTSLQGWVPLRHNPYYFLRQGNYEDRTSIKFSRQKYRFYIVSRLDGEGLAVTKQLIDNSGHRAYDQYKRGVNFLVDNYPSFWWNSGAAGGAAERVELEQRGVHVIDWNTSVSGTLHHLQNIHFASLNWASTPSDSYYGFRNIHKHLDFSPGALVSCIRSYPTETFKRPLSGLSAFDLTDRTLRSCMQEDASDLPLRHMADVAFAENGALAGETATVWCAVGQDLQRISSAVNVSSVNHYRGNGVAVYSAAGVLLRHFTVENTRGGLLSDAVYRLAYDPYAHRMWVGTYKGVCAYDFTAESWVTPPGLSSSKAAPVYQMYVDPTTQGRFLYVTFSAATTGSTPTISDYRCVLEYEVQTGQINRYKFHGDTMDNAVVVKTAPNTLWGVYWRAATSEARVSKYLTDSRVLVSTVDLATVPGGSFKPTAVGSTFAYRIAAARNGDADDVYVTVRNETTTFNGVLRIRDSGSEPQMTVWGHVDSYAASYRPARLVVPPGDPSAVYCVMVGSTDWLTAARIYRFSEAEPTGTLLTPSGSTTPVTGSINAAAISPDGRTLYFTQSLTGGSQEPVVDFFPSGAVAGQGGYNHTMYSYAGITDSMVLTSAYLDDIINGGTSPEHALDSELYYAQSASQSSLHFNTVFHLLNGYYLAEARFGILPSYPAVSTGGHMFVFDPKACPYAPRVDEERTLGQVADQRTLRARIFSPGFPQEWDNPKSREGGFIASTVNASTVRLTDAAGTALGTESIAYLEREEAGRFVCEVLVRSAADLPFGAVVHLTLECGVRGIKNNKGASLINTRPDEFKDEITLVYRIALEEGAPPVVLAHPLAQTVGEGDAAVFSVSANGGMPLRYQWLADGAEIPGATEPTYTSPPVAASDTGRRFSVRISNGAGELTSDPATLIVQAAAPTITSHPRGPKVSLGRGAQLEVTAKGTPPLSYQWFKNAVSIAGANSPTYLSPAVAASDDGAVFSVHVSNSLGLVTSSGAPLEVLVPPTITTQPSSVTKQVTSVASFSVVASGVNTVAPLTYQWLRNGVPLPGATGSSYYVAPVMASDNGAVFAVLVSNSEGTVRSADAVLTVLFPPSVVGQPASQTVMVGQCPTFSVTATGTPPLTYRWQRGSTFITGATAASYTAPAVSLADNGATFRVLVGNTAGSVYSAYATLTVIPFNSPPALTADQPALTVSEGSLATLQGSYSDAQGNSTVTLSSSVGTIVGVPETGRWTWSFQTSDGPDQSQKVTLTATDGVTTPATLNFDLGVHNVTPTALDESLATNEDQPLSLTLTAQDPGSDSLTFTVTTPPLNGLLSGTAPNLVYTPNPYFHGTDSFRFQAADSDGAVSTAATVSLTIRPVNNPPSELTLSAVEVQENQPIGTPVGAFLTVDPDTEDTFTYDLVDGIGGEDNASFQIAGDQLLAAASFDFEDRTAFAIRVRATDSGGLSIERLFAVAIENIPEATVVGRRIFYNQSSWDGKNAQANELDDGAIAPDKQALRPGEKASFANYTSYSRGINGIMIDLANLGGAPTANDFTFKVGNNNDPTTWTDAPLPTSVTVRKGAGADGSDRVTLIWPNWPDPGSIAKQWLQIIVQCTPQTDLATRDVFYFGNALGDTGDSTVYALVTVADRELIRVNWNSPLNFATITSPYDIDRDRLISVVDQELARVNATTPLTMLRLITVSTSGAGLASARETAGPGFSGEGDSSSTSSRSDEIPWAKAVDRTGTIRMGERRVVLQHPALPGCRWLVQWAPTLAGPWRELAGSDCAAAVDGDAVVELPIMRGGGQRYFRWIDIGPSSGLGASGRPAEARSESNQVLQIGVLDDEK